MLFSTVLFAGFGCALAPANTAPVDDVATIMQWWNGDYHNDAQIKRLLIDGKPVWRADDSGEGGHIEVTSHYRTVDLPAFGANVIYVEETKHGDPNSMFRQRIYTVERALDDGQVSVKLWYFKDKKALCGRVGRSCAAERSDAGTNVPVARQLRPAGDSHG
ncbi:MAG: CpcT/CpeT family chromophore lyase [Gammaproteobacteria bacterium]